MKKITLFFAIITIPFLIKAGNNDSALHAKVGQWMSNTGIRFMENKGQMMDMQRKPVPNVLYEANGGGMDVYVTTSGLSYVFVKLENHKKKNSLPIHFKEHNDSITETYCRADMQLVGADIRKENIVKEGESENRTDYYYGDICPNGILGVHSYEKITIKNIYPGIDWVLHSGKNGLKYDFIVHPGADPSQIKLKYKWTDKPQLQEDGSIKISTPMGSITEGTPISYCNGEQVQTTYVVKDSEIHFNVSNYNSTQTLIIDPALVWATYYGSNGFMESDEVYAVQDDGNNVWITGTTGSTIFPTLNPGGGAYFQGAIAGAQNAFILQFNTAGVLKWATFYGGNNGDYGYSIYSDKTNVWVTGTTQSTNFPTYNPGGGAYYQGTFTSGSGDGNAFILQFSTAGVRKWATYYGGNSQAFESGNSICSDGANVWVTGFTSSANFPVFNPGGGAYFQGTMRGAENAFILQFNTLGVRKWATYYGGNASNSREEGTSINSDGSNVWVTGYTTSANFPTYNPGGGAYFQAALAGTSNAFILQFNMAGVCKWATYYGGINTSPYYEGGSSIYSDSSGVWVTGYTRSTNFPVLNPGGGAYFQSVSGGTYNNAFILQFNTAGVRKWATYYGGSGNDNGYSIQSDGTNVWVCGSTTSHNFPTLNSGCGFYQDTLGHLNIPVMDSIQDVFILQFSTAGVRKWATYCGTDVENDGSYAWSDGTNLFVAGDAGKKGYPTVNPGGGTYFWDSGSASGTENAFIGKFIIAAGTGKISVSPATSICEGGSTTLTAGGITSDSWNPPTGLSATNIADPVASPTVTTTYTVTGIDTAACGEKMTDSVTVIVYSLQGVSACCDSSITKGEDVQLISGGGGSYSWSPSQGLSCTDCPDPVASPNQTTTYTLTIKNDSGCTAERFITIDVSCGTVFVPDIFSPNQAHNNILYVRGPCIASMEFKIFDRWDNEVFESISLNNGWDGNYKNKPMNPDTYAWVLKANMKDGTVIKKSGMVTLIR